MKSKLLVLQLFYNFGIVSEKRKVRDAGQLPGLFNKSVTGKRNRLKQADANMVLDEIQVWINSHEAHLETLG